MAKKKKGDFQDLFEAEAAAEDLQNINNADDKYDERGRLGRRIAGALLGGLLGVAVIALPLLVPAIAGIGVFIAIGAGAMIAGASIISGLSDSKKLDKVNSEIKKFESNEKQEEPAKAEEKTEEKSKADAKSEIRGQTVTPITDLLASRKHQGKPGFSITGLEESANDRESAKRREPAKEDRTFVKKVTEKNNGRNQSNSIG